MGTLPLSLGASFAFWYADFGVYHIYGINIKDVFVKAWLNMPVYVFFVCIVMVSLKDQGVKLFHTILIALSYVLFFLFVRDFGCVVCEITLLRLGGRNVDSFGVNVDRLGYCLGCFALILTFLWSIIVRWVIQKNSKKICI